MQMTVNSVKQHLWPCRLCHQKDIAAERKKARFVLAPTIVKYKREKKNQPQSFFSPEAFVLINFHLILPASSHVPGASTWCANATWS